MRVKREAGPIECMDCPDSGRIEQHYPGHPHYEFLRQLQDEEDEDERGRYGAKAVTASAGEPYAALPETGEETWRHLQEEHGVEPSAASDKMPARPFMVSLHNRFHGGQVAGWENVTHQHHDPSGQSAVGRPRTDLSRMFTPIPAEELEEQRRAREPRPERLDDREYSINDVSRHYDWEGFDPHEIEHLVHRPGHAVFTKEDVPVKSLRLTDEHGHLVPAHSYQDIAGQDDDERERLSELERGYDEDAPIPPIVTVRDGEHHVIADGSHRAAIYARQGRTHIPAFVTQRTIHPGGRIAMVKEVTLIPVYDTAPAALPAAAVSCPAVAAVAEAVHDFGAWEPPSAADAVQAVAEFGAVFTALRNGFLRVERVLEDLPVDPEVGDLFHQMAASMLTAAEDAARIARELPTEASWEDPGGSPNR
jgi:hypothetical protein